MVEANNISTTFRKATPVQENTVEESKSVDKAKFVTSGPEVDIPIALHQELKGIPYTAEYFGVKSIWNSPDLGMAKEVQAIEDSYRTQVQEGKIQDGVDNFKKFIKEAEKITNSESSPSHIRIAKISEYLKFITNLKEIDKNSVRYGTTR